MILTAASKTSNFVSVHCTDSQLHSCFEATGEIMRTVKDLKLLPVWVNSGHLVSSALHIMRGHRLKSLAVVDNGGLVGMLSLDRLTSSSENLPVSAVLDPAPEAISASTHVRRAAEIFVEHDLVLAPVIEDERFLGIVTANMLLQELGRSWDPLTNLSWSDRLRDWGVENLKAGREVTIIFIDLDDFGNYNKKYGHIVGDRVLRRVAGMLADSIHDDDVLVRYGGDEFAISTLRGREAAESTVREIIDSTKELFMEDFEEPVSFCTGISGGKRTKERDNTHYAATLDALINMASRECLSRKRLKAVSERATAEPAKDRSEQCAQPDCSGPTLVMVSASDATPSAPTTVWINLAGSVVHGNHLRSGRSLTESVAIATAKALERAFPGVEIVIDDIFLTEPPGSAKLVGISGRTIDDRGEHPLGTAKPVGDDLYQSVAQATIEAFLESIA